MRQGENAERVKDSRSVRDRGEQPIKVVLVDTLREECDNTKKPSSVRSTSEGASSADPFYIERATLQTS